MSEERSTRIRRPTTSINTNDLIKGIDESQIAVDREGNFDELCKKGLIKPGMVVVFANENLPKISLEYEQTGVEQNYEAHLNRGIIVESSDGKLAVFTVLSNVKEDGELKLRGRFARANYSNVLSNCIAQEVEKLLPGSNVSILTRKEYIHCFNKSKFFVNYIFEIGDFDYLFLVDAAVSKDRSVIKIKNNLDPSNDTNVVGDVAIYIIPQNASCTLKLANEITTNRVFSYQYSPYARYLEMR